MKLNINFWTEFTKGGRLMEIMQRMIRKEMSFMKPHTKARTNDLNES